MGSGKVSFDEVVEANIEVHSVLANSGEYNKSPHFRSENKIKVRKILEDLLSQTPSKNKSKVLDLGCGTGFIIHLLEDLVERVDGIDITEDMMCQVDLSRGNIYLKMGLAEDTGYPNEEFDMVTAYSFMDHLLDYKKVVKEAFRVLQKGGVFYSDLNPNRAFSNMLLGIEKSEDDSTLPYAVKREIRGMLHNGSMYEEEFGLSDAAVTKAEPTKSYDGGFDAQEVLTFAKSIGFTKVKCEYDWFLGQGVLMNSDSTIDIECVGAYLNQMLPASGYFYKYLRFIFIK